MKQENTHSNLEKLFLALSDKTRLKLVGLMASGEVSVGFLVEQIGESQPKVSRHLAYLRSMGVVATRRDGKWIYYMLEPQTDAAVSRVLDATLAEIDGRDKQSREMASRSEVTVTENLSHYSKGASVPETASEELDIFLL